MPDIQMLDEMVPRLHNLRLDLTYLLTEGCARTYGMQKGTSFTYDLEAFTQDLRNLSNYRRGLRRAVNDAGQGDDAGSSAGTGCRAS